MYTCFLTDRYPAPSKRRSRVASGDSTSPKKPRKKKADNKPNEGIPAPNANNISNMQTPLISGTST